MELIHFKGTHVRALSFSYCIVFVLFCYFSLRDNLSLTSERNWLTNWKLVTGQGAPPYLASERVCATEQGMVFKVLSLKQGIQSLFSFLNRPRVSFWAGGWQFVVPTFFLQKKLLFQNEMNKMSYLVLNREGLGGLPSGTQSSHERPHGVMITG